MDFALIWGMGNKMVQISLAEICWRRDKTRQPEQECSGSGRSGVFSHRTDPQGENNAISDYLIIVTKSETPVRSRISITGVVTFFIMSLLPRCLSCL